MKIESIQIFLLNLLSAILEKVLIVWVAIFIPRNDIAQQFDVEIYLVDLIGLKVLDKNQNKIGSAIDTMVLPVQNLLVVETNGR